MSCSYHFSIINHLLHLSAIIVLSHVMFVSDYVDSSGMRMWVSPTLREFDSATLMAGVKVSYEHLIPPGAESFRTDGHCLHSCLSDVSCYYNNNNSCHGYLQYFTR